MSPPQQMGCSTLGCEYLTPPSIPSYELVLKALDLHIRSAHNHSNDNVKVEKPKRPSLTTNMSELDWTFLGRPRQRDGPFNRYVSLCNLK